MTFPEGVKVKPARSRATQLREWRHRTGRSKRRCPKGQVDYRHMAWCHARRNYRALLSPQFRDDLGQTIELICFDAERRSAWGKGGRPNRVGQTRFVKMLNAALHRMAVNYGLRKPRGGGYRHAARPTEWINIYSDQSRSAAQLEARVVLRQIGAVVGTEIVVHALLGSPAAVREIQRKIGLEK